MYLENMVRVILTKRSGPLIANGSDNLGNGRDGDDNDHDGDDDNDDDDGDDDDDEDDARRPEKARGASGRVSAAATLRTPSYWRKAVVIIIVIIIITNSPSSLS